MKLGDIIKSINLKLDPDLININNSDEYVPFVMNRIYSNFPDTLFYVSILNSMPSLDRDMQYKYLFYAVPKQKRFSPLKKVEKDENLCMEVSSLYGLSKKSIYKHYYNLIKEMK